MNHHAHCPHCGHVTTAYLIVLNRPLVLAFLKFAQVRVRASGPLKKCQIELDHSQYGNFQKLRHFGLVEKREGQTWEMTPTGWDFVRGRASVLSPAGQFGNATLPPEHPAWGTHPGGRKAVTIREVLPSEWQTFADYVQMKVGGAA